MKVRLKLRGQTRVIELDGTDPTLTQLKVSVCDKFDLDSSNVEFSLNKKDVLCGEDIHLSELGIVSGDLVHIMGIEEDPPNVSVPPVRPRPQPMATHQPTPFSHSDATTSADQNNCKDDDDNDENLLHRNSSADLETASASSHEGTQSDGLTHRSLEEPFVIRESTSSRVPALLQELFQSTDIQSPNDALFLLLHALMLESGFSPPETVPLTRMPEGWRKSGLYVCTYEYPITPSVSISCCLMAVTTGSAMAVHGLSKTVGNFKTDHLQLRADNYVRDCSQENAASAYRSLERVSTLFKDTIGIVLQNHLATSAGFRETQGLLSLPNEIKMRVMCFLDAKSVCKLGQTCHQMRAVFKDAAVWRRLYLETFGRLDDNSLAQDWYEIFKDRYEMYIREQARRRQFYADVESDFGFPHHNPRGPFNPFNPANPFPRFLGGEHDLRPHFPDMQDLINGTRSLPQTLNPFRSLSQPGNRRGNMTGSPFTNRNNPGTFL